MIQRINNPEQLTERNLSKKSHNNMTEIYKHCSILNINDLNSPVKDMD